MAGKVSEIAGIRQRCQSRKKPILTPCIEKLPTTEDTEDTEVHLLIAPAVLTIIRFSL